VLISGISSFRFFHGVAVQTPRSRHSGTLFVVKRVVYGRDLKPFRASLARGLRCISTVLRPTKGVAEVPANNDDAERLCGEETWADASEQDKFEVLAMTASHPITPPEPHFCFDRPPDSAFKAFKEPTRTNARMDAGTCSHTERHYCLQANGYLTGVLVSLAQEPPNVNLQTKTGP
jgi:hypothetical protein